MREFIISYLEASKAIKFEILAHCGPPDEGIPSTSQQVLPFSLVRGTRGYLERIVNQINGTYEKGWFDCCAVIIRRFIETLIIEVFEYHNIAKKIKNKNGDFIYLNELIETLLVEKTWNIGRNAKGALVKLKNMGDKSAHSRRFNARRWDIDRNIDELRVASEELIYLSGLK